MRHRREIVACLCCIWSLAPIPEDAAGQVAVMGLPTSQTALLGRFARGPIDLPVEVGMAGFDTLFSSADPAVWPAEVQARQFFANGGTLLYIVRVAETASLADALAGDAAGLTGLHSLEPISDLGLLIVPELSLLEPSAFADAFDRFRSFLEPRRIFLILDPPPSLADASAMVSWVQGSVPADAAFCAIYFPYLEVLLDGNPVTVGACGAMAAIYVKNDDANGIWRSPSGTSLPIEAQGLHPVIGGTDSDLLSSNHVNPIREFAGIGIVPFGSRSLDRFNSENRFISVVRTRDWIAASIERALAFAAVADNRGQLWDQIRSMVEGFLFTLFRRGALLGQTPDEAYFVRCDATTTSPADIAAHRVKVLYGIALLRANEFDLTTLSGATYDAARAVPEPTIHVRALPSDLVLAYPTIAGFNYVLEINVNLDSGAWAADGPAFDGDGAWRRPFIPMTAERSFYRLRITPAR